VPKKLTREEKIKKYNIGRIIYGETISNYNILEKNDKLNLKDFLTEIDNFIKTNDLVEDSVTVELEVDQDYYSSSSFFVVRGSKENRVRTDEEIDNEIKRQEEFMKEQRQKSKKLKLEYDKKQLEYLKKKYPEEFK
jgi:hypothetical protein